MGITEPSLHWTSIVTMLAGSILFLYAMAGAISLHNAYVDINATFAKLHLMAYAMATVWIIIIILADLPRDR